MAVSLTITVTDAQATRARTAFGKYNTDTPPVWVLATAAEMQAAIKAWVKSRIMDYETTQENEASRASKSAETW